MLKIRLISIHRIWLVFYIFCCIFAPPLLPINLLFPLSIIAIFSLFIESRKKIRIDYNIYKFIHIIIIFSIYVAIIILINFILDNNLNLFSNRITVLYQLIILMPFQLLNISYILNFSKKHNFETNDIIKFIIYAGLIQAFLSILAYFIPNIREFFLLIINSNTGKEQLYANTDFLSYRGYGFAETLLDTFGYGMGLITGYSILTGKEINFKYFMFSIPMLFTTMINSRTGILITTLAVAILFIPINFTQCKIKLTMRKILNSLFLVILIGCVIVLFLIFSKDNSQTFDWIKAGFESVFNFVTNKTSNYSLGSMQNSLLSENYWILPQDFFSLLFGKGYSIFSTRILLGYHSDVGYVNYIWISGVIGLIFVITIFMQLFRKAYLKVNKNTLYCKILLFNIISFFVMMVKGNMVGYNAGTFITLLLTFTFLFKFRSFEN